MSGRLDELWSRFRAGGTLAPSEENELLQAMEADASRRERFLDDLHMDGLLQAVNTVERDADAFCAAFRDRLSLEEDASGFVARIEREVGSRRRRFGRRISGREGRPSFGLLLAACAAAFVAVVAALASRPTDPPRPRPAAAVKPEPLPERIEEAPLPRREIERREAPAVPPPLDAPSVRPSAAPEPPAAPPVPPPLFPAPLPVPPAPEPPPAPVSPTVVAAAPAVTVEKAEGVNLASIAGEERAVHAGDSLPAGSALKTREGAAVLAYRDGTRLHLAPGTEVTDLSADDAPKGKSLELATGTLAATVVRQPNGRPFVVRTAHAEARVLGTSFRLVIVPEGTRLEVESGKVRLTRLADGRAVDVPAGHVAIAAPGLPLAAKSLAPKARRILRQDDFADPRTTDAAWRPVGPAGRVRVAGRLEIDLSPDPAGWTGGGLASRQPFATPFAVEADVDLSARHAGVVATITFVPQGQRRGSPGTFRLQVRDGRYSLTAEAGEPRELAGVDGPAGAPRRERWRAEIDGADVRFLVDGREVLRHRHDLPSRRGYAIELDASARPDAPPGARAAFDDVLVEALEP